MGDRSRFVLCDPMNRLGPNRRSGKASIYEFLERFRCGERSRSKISDLEISCDRKSAIEDL